MSKAKAKIKSEQEDRLEFCPRCSGDLFSISEGEPHQRYCSNRTCGNIWLPMSIDEIKLNHSKRRFGEVMNLVKECDHIIGMYRAGDHIDTPELALQLIRKNLQKIQNI